MLLFVKEINMKFIEIKEEINKRKDFSNLIHKIKKALKQN